MRATFAILANIEIYNLDGINHIDTARSYGDAEAPIGPWMEHHRQNFFLATKSGKRSYKGACRA
jgi:aryl-alcohol dehydrogenase-like predicted oxidoreductase